MRSLLLVVTGSKYEKQYTHTNRKKSTIIRICSTFSPLILRLYGVIRGLNKLAI